LSAVWAAQSNSVTGTESRRFRFNITLPDRWRCHPGKGPCPQPVIRTPPVPRKLRRLVYRSDSLIDHGQSPALDAIFRTSVRNNRRDGITGTLALPDGKFVQAIEGMAEDIDRLMVRLRADSRHENLFVLGEWPITARLFPGWAMARPDATPLSNQAFRIVTEDGSGVQVTGILLGMTRGPAATWL
jgi:hypothetical protein